MTVKKIVIHRTSCRACGEMFSALSSKEAKNKHKKHIKECKMLLFWEKANKILERVLTAKEVAELLRIKIKSRRGGK